MLLAGRYAYKKYKESKDGKSEGEGEDQAQGQGQGQGHGQQQGFGGPSQGGPPPPAQGGPQGYYQPPPNQQPPPQFQRKPSPQPAAQKHSPRPSTSQDEAPLWYPPKNEENLPYPVVLPQRKSTSGSCKFARAYAPVLADKGINQPAFLEYLEKFEQSIKNHPTVAVLNIGPGGQGVDPSLFAVFAHNSGEALEHVGLAQRNQEVNPFLDRMNEQLFKPRGMLCVLTTLQPSAGEVVRILDVQQFANAAAGPGLNPNPSELQPGSEVVDAADLVFEQVDAKSANSRGATRLALRPDALYLMFVNLPSQREVEMVMSQDHSSRPSGSRAVYPDESEYTSNSGLTNTYQSPQYDQNQTSNNPFVQQQQQPQSQQSQQQQQQQQQQQHPQQAPQLNNLLTSPVPDENQRRPSSPTLTHTHPPEPTLKRADFTLADEPMIAQNFNVSGSASRFGGGTSAREGGFQGNY